MRTAVFPMNSMHVKPSFWGIERNLKDVLGEVEDLWDEKSSNFIPENTQETDQLYLTTIDIPGIGKDSLDIQVQQDHILVEGERKSKFLDDQKDKNRKISTTIFLAKDVDRDKIQAHYEDGVLYLALPKIEKAKPKKLKVSTGDKNSDWNNFLTDVKES